MGCTYWHLGLQVLAQAAGAPQALSRVHDCYPSAGAGLHVVLHLGGLDLVL